GAESESWRQSQVTHVAPLSQVTRVASQPPAAKTGSKMVIAVAVTAVVMVVLFSILGLGAWLLLRNPTDVAKNTGPNINIPTTYSPSPTPTYSPSTTPTRTVTPTPQTSPSSTPFATPTPALKSYPSTTRLT